jgi:periplasmic protein TonB
MLFTRMTPKPRSPFPGPAAGPSSFAISATAHGFVLGGLALALGFWSTNPTVETGAREFTIIASVPPPEVVSEDLAAEDLTLEPSDEPYPAPPLEIPAEFETPDDPPLVPAKKQVDQSTLPVPPPTDLARRVPPAGPSAANSVTSLPDLPTTPDPIPVAVPIEASAPAPEQVTPDPDPVQDAPTVATEVEGHCPLPDYPRLASTRKWEGVVLVTIDVRVDGSVSDVRVVTSSGYKVLDEEVLSTVRGWRFQPARTAGIAQKSEIEKRFRFDLQGVTIR